LILRQLCKGLTLSICAVDSEEWHRDNGYDLEADNNDLLNLSPDDNNDNDELKEGNHILYTTFSPAKEIHTKSSVLQRLTRGIPHR
jgi:hypothetical protein